MVKPEYSYIRDNRFSLWHRKINDKYYMTDIDSCMWLLYQDQAQPIALLEEKSYQKTSIDLNDFQFQSLRNLAAPLQLPLFLIISHFNEEQKYFSFYVVAANQIAKDFFASLGQKDRRYMTEMDYVNFESHLRKSKPDLTKVDKACILLDEFKLPKIINLK